jgi:hypothetical protein
LIHAATGSGDLPGEVDQNIFTDTKHVHRGEDDVDEEAKLPSLERTCKEFTPVNKITQFFSTYEPKKLFEAVALFADSMNALDYSFNRDHYKMYIKMETDVKVNENDDEEEAHQEIVEFSVSVLKVPDQEKFVVDFTRVSGDILAFNKIYKDCKEFCGGLVNSTK